MAQRTIIAVLAVAIILLCLGSLNGFDVQSHGSRYEIVSGVYADEPPTDTPIPPTDTPVPTDTPIPPTDTLVPTETPIPPTDTLVPTDTPETPSATPITPSATPVTPTKVPTKTKVPTPTLSPTPTNKRPFIDLDTTSPGIGYNKAAFLSGGLPVSIVSYNLTVGDPDGSRLRKATVKIVNRKDGPSEILAISPGATAGTKIVASFNKDNGTLTLSGTDTFGHYQQVLRTVTYLNTKNPPNSADRQISFVVTDAGNANNQPKAVSTVKIVAPAITISKTTKTPTIAKGDTAKFTITIENTGNVDLTGITVVDVLAPDCGRTNLPPLSVSAKPVEIDCELANVTEEFINFANVTAVDQYGNLVSASDSVPIEILNPNIQVVKSPTTQTVLRGEKANFKIFVINTSSNVSLTEVVVVDALVPGCDAEIGNLRPGKSKEYDCVSEAVDAPFINEITASGKNIFNGEEVRDGSRAFVEVLDMQATFDATPMVVKPGSGFADYTIVIKNKGSVPFEIKSLIGSELGAIHDPANKRLENNSCADARNVEIRERSNFTCQFTTDAPSKQGIYTQDLVVTAKDEENTAITADATAELIIANPDLLEATLEAKPSSLPAPGGSIKEILTVSNHSADSAVELEAINHSTLQGLNKSGSCVLPQNLQPGESYSCEIETEVSGGLDETITHRVAATGYAPGGTFVAGSAEAKILIFDPDRQVNWLPMVAVREAHPEENNDMPCSAYPIAAGNLYQFTVDDKNDWYYFDVPISGLVTIQIHDLHALSAQAAVYANNTCDKIVAGDRVAYNGDESPEKNMAFPAAAIRHYLWIFDPEAETRSIDVPYSVQIQLPR